MHTSRATHAPWQHKVVLSLKVKKYSPFSINQDVGNTKHHNKKHLHSSIITRNIQSKTKAKTLTQWPAGIKATERQRAKHWGEGSKYKERADRSMKPSSGKTSLSLSPLPFHWILGNFQIYFPILSLFFSQLNIHINHVTLSKTTIRKPQAAQIGNQLETARTSLGRMTS